MVTASTTTTRARAGGERQQNVVIRMPAALIEQVREVAQREDRTTSSVIRRAVAQALASADEPQSAG